MEGGISTGGAIRAVRDLGADLAYPGTRFLAATESLAVEDFKDMVVASDLGDIIATDAITGALANKLRLCLIRAGIAPDTLVFGRAFDLSQLDKNTRKWRDLWSAGHGVGAVRRTEPADDIIAALKDGYHGPVRQHALLTGVPRDVGRFRPTSARHGPRKRSRCRSPAGFRR